METKVVVDFADAISHADVDRMCSLMTDDHLFIDSQDNKMEGKETMRIRLDCLLWIVSRLQNRD